MKLFNMLLDLSARRPQCTRNRGDPKLVGAIIDNVEEISSESRQPTCKNAPRLWEDGRSPWAPHMVLLLGFREISNFCVPAAMLLEIEFWAFDVPSTRLGFSVSLAS